MLPPGELWFLHHICGLFPQPLDQLGAVTWVLCHMVTLSRPAKWKAHFGSLAKQAE